jgi:hypothetical protein
MSNIAEEILDEVEKELSAQPGSGEAEDQPSPVVSEEGGEGAEDSSSSSGSGGGSGGSN